MAPRSPAVLRARRRGESAGAVIFVVAMTLVVLASMGIYAMRSASTEIQTSGFARQSTQTHYLAEYGILSGATQVQASPSLYMQLMANVNTCDTKCSALTAVDAAVAAGKSVSDDSRKCRRIMVSELAAIYRPLTGSTARNPVDAWGGTSAAHPGSLGAIPFTGTFTVELTEPANTTPPAGYDQAQALCFNQFTVTSTGITNATGGSTTATFAGQGVEISRARVTAGPTRCQK